MQQQSYIPSSNGLQSFAEASPDYELAPIGIASMHEQAQKLAEYGRNGDIYVVHAAEGETVIPLEVLNKNPKIKELLFKQMEEMGLDPQEFVVGNELNSINPDTGLPEFFFKSVFRAVKKAVKSVVKVAKKLAPIVLPIAAAAFGVPFLGPMFGAGTFGASFLGSGIGSLIGGASIKDSLKSALISGGTASITAGFTGSGSFGQNLSSSFTGATPVFNAAGTQIGTQYAPSYGADALGSSAARQASAAASDAQFGLIGKGDFLGAFTGEGQMFGDTPTGVTDSSGALKPGFTFEGATAPTPFQNSGMTNVNLTSTPSAVEQARALNLPMDESGNFYSNNQIVAGPNVTASSQPLGTGNLMTSQGTSNLQNVGSVSTVNPVGARELTTLEQIQQYTPLAKPTYEVPGQAGQYLVGDAAEQAARKAGMDAAETALGQYANSPVGVEKIISAGDAAAAATMPGIAQKYGTALALGTGAAYLGGAFDPAVDAEQPTAGDLEGFVPSETGYDLFQKDPQKYLVQDTNPYRYDPGNPAVPTRFKADGGYMENPQYMNMGGTPQFPRREMLVEGPGTERSDDIPAMLSDGEFVMNAKAVRGADPSGNGNRQAGASNLYNMMRNFEMRS